MVKDTGYMVCSRCGRTIMAGVPYCTTNVTDTFDRKLLTYILCERCTGSLIEFMDEVRKDRIEYRRQVQLMRDGLESYFRPPNEEDLLRGVE